MYSTHFVYVALAFILPAKSLAAKCGECLDSDSLHATRGEPWEVRCGELQQQDASCRENIWAKRYRCSSCGTGALGAIQICCRGHVIHLNYYQPRNCNECGTDQSLHWTGVTERFGCGTLRSKLLISDSDFCRENIRVKQYECLSQGCNKAALVATEPCRNARHGKPAVVYYKPGVN
ncbi:hypothetical protein PGT21_026141 [Puccinia graminis f. sp. tritici]|uniref:Uncharacterized protein n=1 Tax=Puccinia graminis f. sp. tritici TaxID=56615 RepID=A0A5B0LWE5_PUCGR|nr:hypothetical protein PGTUg99_016632 [Puccinia graminis f. sp. tritici]KAA1104530.1 hypothetical protein PGT21_026141 [Puccinia graminis f. sp. tritici]